MTFDPAVTLGSVSDWQGFNFVNFNEHFAFSEKYFMFYVMQPCICKWESEIYVGLKSVSILNFKELIILTFGVMIH